MPPTVQPIAAPSFEAIWWDGAVLKRRTQSLEFFGAYKKAGGELDDLVQVHAHWLLGHCLTHLSGFTVGSQ